MHWALFLTNKLPSRGSGADADKPSVLETAGVSALNPGCLSETKTPDVYPGVAQSPGSACEPKTLLLSGRRVQGQTPSPLRGKEGVRP